MQGSSGSFDSPQGKALDKKKHHPFLGVVLSLYSIMEPSGLNRGSFSR